MPSSAAAEASRSPPTTRRPRYHAAATVATEAASTYDVPARLTRAGVIPNTRPASAAGRGPAPSTLASPVTATMASGIGRIDVSPARASLRVKAISHVVSSSVFAG